MNKLEQHCAAIVLNFLVLTGKFKPCFLVLKTFYCLEFLKEIGLFYFTEQLKIVGATFYPLILNL